MVTILVGQYYLLEVPSSRSMTTSSLPSVTVETKGHLQKHLGGGERHYMHSIRNISEVSAPDLIYEACPTGLFVIFQKKNKKRVTL